MVSTQKQLYFCTLAVNNSKKIFLIPFTIASKRIKYFRNKFNKKSEKSIP